MGRPLAITEQIKAAGIMLMIARASFDIWWLYRGAPTRKRYLPGMNRYSEFFRFDEAANLRAAVISFVTLFDRRDDAITLASLVAQAADAGHEVGEIKSRLAQLTSRMSKMKLLRHNLFAHRNREADHTDVYKKAEFRPDNFKAMLDEGLAILNEIADRLSLPRTAYNRMVEEHTTNLLGDIQPNRAVKIRNTQ
jgi:hypothetical protein